MPIVLLPYSLALKHSHLLLSSIHLSIHPSCFLRLFLSPRPSSSLQKQYLFLDCLPSVLSSARQIPTYLANSHTIHPPPGSRSRLPSQLVICFPIFLHTGAHTPPLTLGMLMTVMAQCLPIMNYAVDNTRGLHEDDCI